MEGLLEKTRAINKLIQKAAGHPVDFNEIAEVLGEKIRANTYIAGRRGRVLGYWLQHQYACDIIRNILENVEHFPENYSQSLQKVNNTRANIPQKNVGCEFFDKENCPFDNKVTTVVPIVGGGERLGTLVLVKVKEEFNNEDLILAEYGSTVVGMEILRVKAERVEEEARKKAAVQIALGTLTFSELEAIEHIFEELQGDEGLLVASKIADRVGITRSVIVNALRKFESAGVIESKSLGMKGTYIRILNERLMEELQKFKHH